MCDLKQCGEKLDFRIDDVVDVKTLWPKSKVDTEALKIGWNPKGEAKFHKTCWEKIVTFSRKTTKTAELRFTQLEKTLIREAMKTAEFIDSTTRVLDQAKRVSLMLKAAGFCVAFTGAGISTSAGIGDYRGKSGKWTEMDQKCVNVDQLFQDSCDEHPPGKKQKMDNDESLESDEEGVPYESLRPTYTHEALQKLMTDGYLKYIISQNGDGLHGLSGVPPEKLSELHGNVFLEMCEKCGKEYYRDYYVMDDVGSQYYEEIQDYGKTDIKKPRYVIKCERCGLSHRTGRKCEVKGCKGYLKDSIINFGDLLNENIHDRACKNSEMCDLMLCLGTTLTVTPANELVDMIKDPHRLVICNRQVTDYDDLCDKKGKDGSPIGARIFGDCDTFFRELMKHFYKPEEVKEWENDGEKRIKVIYDPQRTDK